MTVCPEALDLIASFEGYLKPAKDGSGDVVPYICPAGVPTIGWGSTRYEDGRKVRMSDPQIGHQRAADLLAYEIRGNERTVDTRITREMHEYMRGACVSFAYNCGNAAFSRSTLRKRIQDGDWEDVPKQFAKWRIGGGRVLKGLVRRRKAEAALFMDGVAMLEARGGWETTVTRESKPSRMRRLFDWLTE